MGRRGKLYTDACLGLFLFFQVNSRTMLCFRSSIKAWPTKHTEYEGFENLEGSLRVTGKESHGYSCQGAMGKMGDVRNEYIFSGHLSSYNPSALTGDLDIKS